MSPLERVSVGTAAEEFLTVTLEMTVGHAIA
jgi:hypothetical protein